MDNMDKMVSEETTGDRIRSARRKCKMNQDELAEKVGYSKSSIWRIENGQRTLPRKKVPVFAKVLGVSSAYLDGYENSATFQQLVNEDNPLYGRLAKALLDLEDDELRAVMLYVEFLKFRR